MADSETPVLDTIGEITEVSIKHSTFQSRDLMLARIAALAAVDAKPLSYLLNVGGAVEAGVSLDDVQNVLIAVAPIIGTARTSSAAVGIAEALGLAIQMAESS